MNNIFETKNYEILNLKNNYLFSNLENGNDLMEDNDIYHYLVNIEELNEERYNIINNFMIKMHYLYNKNEKLKLLMKTNKLCFDVIYYDINKYF